MESKEEIPADHLMLIDPGFDGSFPLGGLVGRVVDQRRGEAGFSLRIEFERVPPTRESALVSAVQQQQLRRVAA